MTHPATLERLRSRLSQLSSTSLVGGAGVLKLHLPQIERALPWRGLARGALHEVTGERNAITAFLAAAIGRDTRSEEVLWVTPGPTLYAHGLAQLGLDHRRLTIVAARRADDRLWASEEGLRELGYGAVVAEIDGADLTETRRLQLAAEKSGSIGFLIRRDRQASAALTRWRIEPARSDGYRPSWRVTLERCRGAEAGFSWDVEWDYATLSFRLVAALADGSLAAAE
ncbi:hypothetical protein [Ferrovibrio sp.]|uniref:ImuA family protein n=1 Tax=Ferrovibrio sp. TaxID=1917215 RepID=UPI001B58F495|nr:hypothetical protein [Ferrovibrio sp.]MBP7065701.1 hypothetical protein [Ferrovibrio sp.]